nr:hypothetical protein [Crepidula fornicata]
MAKASASRLFAVLVMVSSAGIMCEAACSRSERADIIQCIAPYNVQFISQFGTGSTCNKNLITSSICRSYASIVTCVNSKSGISRETCLYDPSQINSYFQIPCKVEAFIEVCTDAPRIGANGSTLLVASLMTTLMTTCLAVVMSYGA